jgi:hypothetical protein
MDNSDAKVISANDEQVMDLMTPAERWIFLGDSFHHSEDGKRHLKEANDWFRPVAVLRGSLSMTEVLEKRRTLRPVSSIITDMYGMITNTKEEGDEIGFHLWAPEAGEQDKIPVDVIKEPPLIKVFKKNGDEVTTSPETFFNYMKNWGEAFNPYTEDITDDKIPGKEQEGNGNKEAY